ncbi:MAG: response regulator transcription factor [bacterium]
MLKVMLVDDEMLVRVGLKSLINWENEGYQIAAEASNGEEALKLIQTLKPDIVIVDIKMPLKDGITLMEDVQELGLKTEFIVLSSFDDFEPVKRAMKLGAVDYLLKLELDEAELLKALGSAVEKISQKKKKSNKLQQQEIKNSVSNLKKKTLQKIVTAVITEKDQIQKLFKELDITLKEEKILCLSLKIKNNEIFNKFNQGEINLYEDSIINIVDEIVNDYYRAEVFIDSWGEIVIILNLDNNLNNEKEKIKKLNYRLQKMINNYFSLSITTAVSNLKNSYSDLSQAFEECSESLNNSFRFSREGLIFYSDLQELEKSIAPDYIKKFAVDFNEALEYRWISKIGQLLTDIIKKIEKEPLSKNNAFNLYYKIINSLENNLNSEKIENICGNRDRLYQNIKSINSNQELITWLDNLTLKLKKIFNQNPDNYLVAKTKEYIKENYDQKLSLESTAQKINVSSGYLSYLFKEESGLSFSEYLNQLRISEAKKLLQNKNLKIYEIADQIGYNNAYYFSRVFKKITGLSPSQYRSRH